MTSPLSTEYSTAGGLSFSRLASSLRDMLSSFAAQKQKRLLALVNGVGARHETK